MHTTDATAVAVIDNGRVYDYRISIGKHPDQDATGVYACRGHAQMLPGAWSTRSGRPFNHSLPDPAIYGPSNLISIESSALGQRVNFITNDKAFSSGTITRRRYMCDYHSEQEMLSPVRLRYIKDIRYRRDVWVIMLSIAVDNCAQKFMQGYGVITLTVIYTQDLSGIHMPAPDETRHELEGTSDVSCRKVIYK
jgi:hypothetical protein